MSWTIESTRTLRATGRPERFEAVPPMPARAHYDGPPWVLFVGATDEPLERAAHDWLAHRAVEVLSPPRDVPLALALPYLAPPRPAAESRALYVKRLDRVFFNTLASGVFSLASPLYVLPKLARSAGADWNAGFVATALESELVSRGPEVLQGRGLAARFVVYREVAESPPVTPTEKEPEGRDLEALIHRDAESSEFLALGLATRLPSVREAAYREAISRRPSNAVARLSLASALTEQGRLPEAVAAVRGALELEPDLDAAHYELAKLLIRTDDMSGAVEHFRRTTELLPEFSSAWTNLGAALGEIEDLEGASAALQNAAKLDPLSHALQSNLGVTFRNLGRYDEAEAAFLKALEIAPDFLFGHYNLAYNLYLQGRYSEAIARFEKARDGDPEKSPRQGILLAIARLAAGDREGAHRDYRAILQSLEGQARADLITVAEWDLGQLERSRPGEASVGETLALVKGLG